MNYEHTCPELIFNLLKEGRANSELMISDEFTEKYSKGDEIKIINSSNQNQSLTRIIEKEATFSSFTDYKTKINDIKLNINVKSFYNLESLCNNNYQTYLIGVEYEKKEICLNKENNNDNNLNYQTKSISIVKQLIKKEKKRNILYDNETKDLISQAYIIYDGNSVILSKDTGISEKIICNEFRKQKLKNKDTDNNFKIQTLEKYIHNKFDFTYEDIKQKYSSIIYDSFEELSPLHNMILGFTYISKKSTEDIAKICHF